MEKNFDLWKSFWETYPKLKEKIEPFAKRSALSPDSAILLILLFEYKDFNFPFAKNFFEELEQKGLIEIKENNIKTTSRGEILSKSFIAVKNQIFKI